MREIMIGRNHLREMNMCSKCGKIPAKVKYKKKRYCTWYCAKKK